LPPRNGIAGSLCHNASIKKGLPFCCIGSKTAYKIGKRLLHIQQRAHAGILHLLIDGIAIKDELNDIETERLLMDLKNRVLSEMGKYSVETGFQCSPATFSELAAASCSVGDV